MAAFAFLIDKFSFHYVWLQHTSSNNKIIENISIYTTTTSCNYFERAVH